MKPLTVFLMAIGLGIFPAHGQSPRIDRVELVRAGTLEKTRETKVIRDADISAGQRTEADAHFVDSNTVVPARDRTVIGAQFEVLGSPRGAVTAVDVVWRYPSPGVINPQTSVRKLVDRFSINVAIGSRRIVYWQLSEAEGTVLGTWTVELWQGNRKLASQDFRLVKP